MTAGTNTFAGNMSHRDAARASQGGQSALGEYNALFSAKNSAGLPAAGTEVPYAADKLLASLKSELSFEERAKQIEKQQIGPSGIHYEKNLQEEIRNKHTSRLTVPLSPSPVGLMDLRRCDH